MPGAEHRVVYRAYADFSNLYAEVAKARAALKTLREDAAKTTRRPTSTGTAKQQPATTGPGTPTAPTAPPAPAAGEGSLTSTNRLLGRILATLKECCRQAGTPGAITAAAPKTPSQSDALISGLETMLHEQTRQRDTSTRTPAKDTPRPDADTNVVTGFEALLKDTVRQQAAARKVAARDRAAAEKAATRERTTAERAVAAEAERITKESAKTRPGADVVTGFEALLKDTVRAQTAAEKVAARDRAAAEKATTRERTTAERAVAAEAERITKESAKTRPGADVVSRFEALLKDSARQRAAAEKAATHERTVAERAVSTEATRITKESARTRSGTDVVTGFEKLLKDAARQWATAQKGATRERIAADKAATRERVAAEKVAAREERRLAGGGGGGGTGGAGGGGGGRGGAGGGGRSGGRGGADDNDTAMMDRFRKTTDRTSGAIGKFLGLFRRFFAIVALIASVLGPAIAALGALGAAALGVGNILISMSGIVAALPGLLAAAALGVGALVVALTPMAAVFKAYSTYQDKAAAGARSMAEAQQQAADRTRSAQRAYSAAARALVDAQASEHQAQVDLNEARRDATRDLQDMRVELARMSLNEQDAVLALAEAEDAYRRALADPAATGLDRERSALRVSQAEWDLYDVRQRNIRLQEDSVVVERRAVQGSQQVVDARKNAAHATEAVTDAAQRLDDASKDLAQARQEEAAGGAVALRAQQAWRDELDKLSPSTRTVALGILSMGAGWKTLQRSVSEALFAPIVGQLGNLKSLLPVLKTLLDDAAGALGEVAARGIEMLSSGPWKADFAVLSKANAAILTSLGDAALLVLAAFKDIAIAAIPFTTWLAAAVKGVAADFADWAARARGNGDLAAFLADTKQRLRDVWEIVGNITGAIGNLYTGTKDFADWLLAGTKSMTQGWQDYTAVQAESGSGLQAWLQDMKPLLSDIGDFIGAVASAFADIAKDPRNIAEAHRILSLLSEKVLPNLVEFFGKFSEAQGVSTLVDALGTLLGAINRFLDAGGALPLEIFANSLLALAKGFDALLSIPGVSTVFVVLATGVAAFIAATAIARFSGFFALLRGLRWLVTNKGAIAGALSNALRGSVTAAGTGTGSPGRGVSTPRSAVVGTYTAQLNIIIGLLRQCCAVLGAGAAADLPGDGKTVITPGTPGGGRGTPTTRPRGYTGTRRAPGRVSGRGGIAGIALTGLAALAGLLFGTSGAGTGAADEQDVPVPGPTGTAARPGTPDVVPAGRAVTGRAGTAGRAGGLAARIGARGVGIANPLSWAGLAVGMAGEYAFDDKQRRTGGAQATRAGGAILTGAGIGAGIGSVVPGVGTAIGAVVGGVAGAGYSAAKDPGLRKTVSEFFAAIGRWFTDTLPKLLGGVGRWFASLPGLINKHLVQPVGRWFTSLPGLINKHLIQPIIRFFTSLPGRGIQSFGLLFGFLEELITNTIPELFTESIPKWWSQGYEWFMTHIGSPVADFITNSIPRFFTESIPRWWSQGYEWFMNHIGSPVAAWFTGLPDRISEWWGSWSFRDLWDKFWASTVVPVRDWFVGLPDRISEWWKSWSFSDLWDKFKANVAAPIGNWFKELPGKITEWTGGAWDWIKDMFQSGREKGKEAAGGQSKQSGGLVEGTPDGRVDTKKLWATAGEFVIRKRVVDKPAGKSLLRDLNEERLDPGALYNALNTTVRAAPTTVPGTALTRTITHSTANTVNTATADTALRIGDITINNPVRERSELSMRRTLQTLAYLGAR